MGYWYKSFTLLDISLLNSNVKLLYHFDGIPNHRNWDGWPSLDEYGPTSQRDGYPKSIRASVSRLAMLFMQEFIGTMLLALLIALPLMYWLGQSWLQGFAYHIAISWLPVLSIGLLFLLGIVILIGIQTWQLTRSNPVKAICDE